MDQQHHHNIKAMLRRYLQGAATTAEKEGIDNWYQSLEDIHHQMPDDPAAIRASALQHIRRHTKPVNSIPVFRRIAAAVILLIVGTAGVMYWQRPTGKSWQTGMNALKTVILPDGSIVNINAQSTLQIPADFGARERKVVLTGEAFFDIKPDAAHPFLVQSGTLQTTVLGTAFNIRAYPDNEITKISVSSGRIQVTVPGHPTQFLSHHETLQYQPVSGSLSRNREDTSLMGQWQSRVLDMNGYTIADMVKELQRHYPVRIQLYSTPADTMHYNITFHQERLENVLQVISQLTGSTYKTVNGQVIIHTKNQCQ
jgi:transmembrane sensor